MKYNEIRRKTKKLKIGNTYIGGDSPIAIQSMTNTDTMDKVATLEQIRALQIAGCDIVRITVPTLEAAHTIPYLKENGIYIPIVADIHFDYRIALRCAELGVDKIRINPGNIGSDDRVKAVADACKSSGIPIRIGINSGSLQKDILEKYKQIIVTSDYAVVMLNKVTTGDCAYWTGTCSISDNNDFARLIAKKIIKEKRNDPTCHVVRS